MALSDQRATYLLFPIAEQVRKCLDSFHELGRIVLSPSRNEAKNLSAFEVSDAADRFRIWAGNIGAHRKDRGSLDYRLRDASHIKDSVLDLLDALLNKMEKASAILRGERLPMEELEFESDSDSEFEEATHEGPVEPFHEATELGQLMESIKEVISMLLRTSMVIRKPAPHDHFANFNQVSTTHFEEFDLRHIQDKFPKASRTLVERLARATASRRSYLKYREDRQINLAAGLDSFDDGGLENKSQPAPSIIATSLNTIIKTAAHLDLDAFSEAGKTETSFASSFHGQNDNILKLPRIPKDGLDGGPFQCPLCFGIISAKTENSWKKHVSKDLAPYVCTFDSCSVPFRRFEKRREWFEHELSHRSKWKCPQNCEKIFDTQQELSEHLKQHSGTFTDPSGECQMRPNATFCVDCALCGKSLPLAQLQSHLGEHQQQLALFALPLQIRNSENDDDFDDDSEAPEEASVDEGGSDTEGSADEDVDANAEEDILDQVEDSEPVGEATQAEESPMREEFDFGTPAFVPINPVFYDCAFSFLGCQYVAGPSDEKEWKEHVLSHFHSHGPPWAVKCPLCDWDFEDSDGRRAWDIRMNHVAAHHRAGQRLRLNDPFWIDPNLLRYLWQKRIIDDEEYEALSASKQLGNDRRVAEHGNRSQRQHRPRRRLDSNGEDVSEADEISVDREALEEDREENEEAETAKSKESGWETLVQTPSEERSDMVRTWLRKGPQDHPAPSPQEGQIELPVNHDQPNAPVSPLDENPQAKVPTYIKIRKEHIEQETLAFFGLLWDWDQSHSDYVVIFRELDNRETDMLFEHTKALRKHRMDSPESDFIWKPESIDHPHEPPQATIPTYPKIHKDHVEQESLAYFGLPWEWDRSDSNYLIILKELNHHETTVLFEHTEALRNRRASVSRNNTSDVQSMQGEAADRTEFEGVLGPESHTHDQVAEPQPDTHHGEPIDLDQAQPVRASDSQSEQTSGQGSVFTAIEHLLQNRLLSQQPPSSSLQQVQQQAQRENAISQRQAQHAVAQAGTESLSPAQIQLALENQMGGPDSEQSPDTWDDRPRPSDSRHYSQGFGGDGFRRSRSASNRRVPFFDYVKEDEHSDIDHHTTVNPLDLPTQSTGSRHREELRRWDESMRRSRSASTRPVPFFDNLEEDQLLHDTQEQKTEELEYFRVNFEAEGERRFLRQAERAEGKLPKPDQFLQDQKSATSETFGGGTTHEISLQAPKEDVSVNPQVARLNTPQTPKGILRRPTEKFPEDPNPVREGVAPKKDASKGKDIPADAHWTRIDRRLVSPEALEEAKERFEERLDCVIVLRVLQKDEIQALADRTQDIREAKGEQEVSSTQELQADGKRWFQEDKSSEEEGQPGLEPEQQQVLERQLHTQPEQGVLKILVHDDDDTVEIQGDVSGKAIRFGDGAIFIADARDEEKNYIKDSSHTTENKSSSRSSGESDSPHTRKKTRRSQAESY